MSSPSSQRLQPVVRTTCGLLLRLMAFCSVPPVEKWMAPSSHTATSGVTWGRPSARTVQIQKISASSSARRVSSHVVAVAAGSLNRMSISVAGLLIEVLLLPPPRSRTSVSCSLRRTGHAVPLSPARGADASLVGEVPQVGGRLRDGGPPHEAGDRRPAAGPGQLPGDLPDGG